MINWVGRGGSCNGGVNKLHMFSYESMKNVLTMFRALKSIFRSKTKKRTTENLNDLKFPIIGDANIEIPENQLSNLLESTLHTLYALHCTKFSYQVSFFKHFFLCTS